LLFISAAVVAVVAYGMRRSAKSVRPMFLPLIVLCVFTFVNSGYHLGYFSHEVVYGTLGVLAAASASVILRGILVFATAKKVSK